MEVDLIYLDNAATSMQYEEVSLKMLETATKCYGNPSSLHSFGLKAEKLVKESKKQLADITKASKVIMTASGTEADNMAIFSYKNRDKSKNRYITSKVEHPAVLESMKKLESEGNEVVYIDVDQNGLMDISRFGEELNENTALVSVMTVNNETGTIQPINQIYDLIKQVSPGAVLHTDAVQAFGKMRLDSVKADMLSISGHKFHGPKGIGALLLRENLNLKPLIYGGGQELGVRSGTENTSSIIGMALAANISYDHLGEVNRRIGEMNSYFTQGLLNEIGDIKINGALELGYSIEDYGRRSPYILNVSFLGTRGEVLLHTLEQDEIFVSTGSACASNKKGKSHVLGSMGLKEKDIEGAIRFSFSEFNTREEMDIVIDKTKKAVARFRKLGSFR